MRAITERRNESLRPRGLTRLPNENHAIRLGSSCASETVPPHTRIAARRKRAAANELDHCSVRAACGSAAATCAPSRCQFHLRRPCSDRCQRAAQSRPADAGHQKRHEAPASACFRTYTSPSEIDPFIGDGVEVLVSHTPGGSHAPRRAVTLHAVEADFPSSPGLVLGRVDQRVCRPSCWRRGEWLTFDHRDLLARTTSRSDLLILARLWCCVART